MTTETTITTGMRVKTAGNIENHPAHGTIIELVDLGKIFGTYARVIFDAPRFEGDDQEEMYPIHAFRGIRPTISIS